MPPCGQTYITASFKLTSLFSNTPSLQVWLCGGSMEVLPCSRVAHIARMKKPYLSNIALHTRRNALRVAEVWLDEYKSNVYLAWNIPMEVRAAGLLGLWMKLIMVAANANCAHLLF